MPSYKNRQCQFCIDKIEDVDYKNIRLLKKYLTQYNKIVPKYYNGNCLKHQKRIVNSIKNARIMALLPFTP